MDKSEYISVGEIADEMGVTRAAVALWLSKGILKDIGIQFVKGGKWFILRSDFERVKSSVMRNRKHETLA